MQHTHYGVSCDSCGQGSISGIRYKCGNCPNYDLCSQCYDKNVKEHRGGNHVFIVLEKNMTYTASEALLPALYRETVIITRADLDKEFFERVKSYGQARAD